MLQSYLTYWHVSSLTRVPPVMENKKMPLVSKISLVGSNILITNQCPTYIGWEKREGIMELYQRQPFASYLPQV